MDALIGIDIGTTNWKVAAFTVDGSMLAIRKTPAITEYTTDGQGYYDPELLWTKICGLLCELADDCAGHTFISAAATSM